MEKSKNIGYVSINSTSLKQVCEECLKYIKDVRELREKASILEFMESYNEEAKKRNSSFLGRWFPILLLTSLEQTKEYMDKKRKEIYASTGFWFSCMPYVYCSSYGSELEEPVERLLHCCNSCHIEDIIQVNAELYSYLTINK